MVRDVHAQVRQKVRRSMHRTVSQELVSNLAQPLVWCCHCPRSSAGQRLHKKKIGNPPARILSKCIVSPWTPFNGCFYYLVVGIFGALGCRKEYKMPVTIFVLVSFEDLRKWHQTKTYKTAYEKTTRAHNCSHFLVDAWGGGTGTVAIRPRHHPNRPITPLLAAFLPLTCPRAQLAVGERLLKCQQQDSFLISSSHGKRTSKHSNTSWRREQRFKACGLSYYIHPRFCFVFLRYMPILSRVAPPAFWDSAERPQPPAGFLLFPKTGTMKRWRNGAITNWTGNNTYMYHS